MFLLVMLTNFCVKQTIRNFCLSNLDIEALASIVKLLTVCSNSMSASVTICILLSLSLWFFLLILNKAAFSWNGNRLSIQQTYVGYAVTDCKTRRSSLTSYLISIHSLCTDWRFSAILHPYGLYRSGIFFRHAMKLKLRRKIIERVFLQ